MADIRTLVTIGSLIAAACGLLFGLMRDRWSRRESRLEIVGQILHPLLEATQSLARANDARRKAEQLKSSFPIPTESVLEGVEPVARFPERTREVVHHVNSLIDSYGEHTKLSEQKFRDAEAIFGAKQLRLPVSVAKQLRELKIIVSEFGRLVDGGFFGKADLEKAKFLDQYKAILTTARGWRLTFPAVQKIKDRILSRGKTANSIPFEFDLSEDEMNGVMELVQRRATTEAGRTFAVHPPQKVLDNSSVLESDDVIEELKDSVFSLVFQDGTTAMLGLHELMAFNFMLITLANETRELDKMFTATPPNAPTTVNLNMTFSMHDVMTPEMVKALLSKFTFSDTASDAV